MDKPTNPNPSSRRNFLKKSTAAVVGGSLAASSPRMVHTAEGDDVLRVGLVGCGGRGKGAAVNALRADKKNRLVALADLFPDKVDQAKEQLAKTQVGQQVDVDAKGCFSGFDAYQQLLKTDVDVVLLCTPPHFRPAQLRASIEAGKHVFCEKPVAVDPTGVRSVLETTELAKEKGLTIVSGLCWRYAYGVRETMKRIQDGMIGDIVAIQENYLTGTLWHRQPKPDWTAMEDQLRNWLYYTWLSGDHIVEQHIHSLDKAMWLMNDEPPARCFGLGGRQVRTDDKWGHIFDHFAICYEWANGTRTYAYTRQMSDCHNDVEDYVLGTKGQARLLRNSIKAGDESWRYRGPKPSMYDVEHVEMFAAIRKGEPINNGKYMSYSTLLAIMGREACYSGQSIGWDEALNSQQDLTPKSYEFGDIPTPSVALPGFTKFS